MGGGVPLGSDEVGGDRWQYARPVASPVPLGRPREIAGGLERGGVSQVVDREGLLPCRVTCLEWRAWAIRMGWPSESKWGSIVWKCI
jgi:hypothetical protein